MLNPIESQYIFNEPVDESLFDYDAHIALDGNYEEGVSMKSSFKEANRKRDIKSQINETSLNENDTKEEYQKELNKIRAKRNRKRKKNYYEDLENRNEFLENQNRKLSALVDELRTKNVRLALENREIIKACEKVESSPYWQNSQFEENNQYGFKFDPIETNFNKNHPIYADKISNIQDFSSLEKRHDLLNECFASILHNSIDRNTHWLLSEIESDIANDTHSLKKFNKMAKFQKHDTLVDLKLTNLEQVLSSLDPNKRQLQLFINFFKPEMIEMKALLKDGFMNLANAQQKIYEAIFKFDSLFKYNTDNKVFQPTNIEKALDALADNNFQASLPLEQVLGVKLSNKEFDFNYHRQCVRASTNSKFAKKLFKYHYDSQVLAF